MDRRRFLLGASALGVTACAQPERELLDEFADATIPLEPGAPRSTTTTVAPVESQAPDEPKPDNGLPVDVPDEDLPGLSFVAEAIVPSVGVSATRAIDEPIMEFANPIPSGGPLAFLVEDLADLVLSSAGIEPADSSPEIANQGAATQAPATRSAAA